MTEQQTNLKIDGDALQALVLKAVLEMWTPEQRDALIINAMNQVLDVKDGYGANAKTHLARGIETGVQQAVVKVIREMIESEYRPRLEAMAKAEFERMFTEDAKGERIVEGKQSVMESIISAGVKATLA